MDWKGEAWSRVRGRLRRPLSDPDHPQRQLDVVGVGEDMSRSDRDRAEGFRGVLHIPSPSCPDGPSTPIDRAIDLPTGHPVIDV